MDAQLLPDGDPLDYPCARCGAGVGEDCQPECTPITTDPAGAHDDVE